MVVFVLAQKEALPTLQLQQVKTRSLTTSLSSGLWHLGFSCSSWRFGLLGWHCFLRRPIEQLLLPAFRNQYAPPIGTAFHLGSFGASLAS